MTRTSENFYKRLRELSDIKEQKKEPNIVGTLVNFNRSNEGIAYGVVKENHHYYIKKSTKQGDNLLIEDFVYISGIENKGEYDYKKVSEAEKQRNFLVMSLNEAFDLGSIRSESKKKSSSLEIKTDINSFLKDKIKIGKKNLLESNEKKFKSSLKKNKEKIIKSKGLMPEAALNAVQKALGKLNEEDLVTADSEIKDNDIVSNKKGKEEAQASINDKNAKTIADKATATGTKDFNKKEDAPKSIAVNQADKKLTEGGDLVTADSELNPTESPANITSGKESAQAPINDENAKTEADKADASGGASAAIQNNAEESSESNPFDDKENAGDEKDDIVTGDKNISEGKDISTKDSDQKDIDRVDNKSEKETPEAPYNSYNQPEKGHKEKKGAELKDTSKEVVIGEGEDLVTADSELNPKDSVVNKATAPSSDKPSEIVADSDLKPKDSVANDTKTNLPNPVFEEDSLIVADSNLKPDDSLANDTKTNLPNPVFEDESLITADSDLKPEDSLANDTKTNLPNPVFEGNGVTEDKITENDEELDAAADALNNLDVTTAANDKEEEMDDEHHHHHEINGEEIPDPDDLNGDELGGEEIPDLGGDEGGENDSEIDLGGDEGGDDKIKEIEKNIGKANQAASDPDVQLDPDKTQEIVNSVLGSFESHISEIDVEEKKKMADKIMRASESNGEEGAKEIPDLGGDEGGENDSEIDSAIDSEINKLGEPEVEEDVILGEKEGCLECGSFKEYAESRGYGDFNECSEGEMTSLVSGYANGFNEGKNDGGFEEIAPCVSDGVKQGLEEYGHVSYLEELQPYLDKVQENQKISFGGFEPMVNMVEDVPEDNGEIEMGIEPEMDVSTDVEPIAEPEMDVSTDVEPIAEPEMDVSTDVEPIAEPEMGIEPEMDVEPIAEPEMGIEPVAEPIGFAAPEEVLSGARVGPEKNVDVDLNAGTIKVTITENEKKLKKYVRSRLDVLSGKKKSSINEGKKSNTLKKLDEIIEKQWNLYGEQIKEHVNK